MEAKHWEAYFAGAATTIGSTVSAAKLLYYDYFNGGGYTYYYLLAYNLQGDPSLDITSSPLRQITADYPDPVIVGMDRFQIAVSDGQGPVGHALVALQKMGEYAANTETDLSGYASAPIALTSAGALSVTVSAHNHAAYVGSTSVVAVPGPQVTGTVVTLDDSAGDNNGVFNPGESVSLSVNATNVGAMPMSVLHRRPPRSPMAIWSRERRHRGARR